MTSIRAQAMKSMLRLASVVAITAIAVTAHAQAPIRIGASLSQTGSFGALGQNQLRGYQLCTKHANEKGGVLGRMLELIVEDDQSQPKTAVGVYERLITQVKVDAILSPYSAPITDAVADLTKKHRMLMVSAAAAATSTFKKGRQYIFMVAAPAEAYLSRLIEMAAARGLKTIAIVHEETLSPRSIAQGAVELAKKRGLQVIHLEAYAKGSNEFASILGRVRAKNPDVLGAATYFEDAIAITRYAKELDVNPKMLGLTSGVDLPKFYEVLGRSAEFIYGGSKWEVELASTRAGGLVPMARQYPGAREFVEAHRKGFPGADDPT